MKSRTGSVYSMILLAALTLGSLPAHAGTDLGDLLHKSGWDGIIGTWVDAETKGSKLTVTYAWRFKRIGHGRDVH